MNSVFFTRINDWIVDKEGKIRRMKDIVNLSSSRSTDIPESPLLSHYPSPDDSVDTPPIVMASEAGEVSMATLRQPLLDMSKAFLSPPRQYVPGSWRPYSQSSASSDVSTVRGLVSLAERLSNLTGLDDSGIPRVDEIDVDATLAEGLSTLQASIVDSRQRLVFPLVDFPSNYPEQTVDSGTNLIKPMFKLVSSQPLSITNIGPSGNNENMGGPREGPRTRSAPAANGSQARPESSVVELTVKDEWDSLIEAMASQAQAHRAALKAVPTSTSQITDTKADSRTKITSTATSEYSQIQILGDPPSPSSTADSYEVHDEPAYFDSRHYGMEEGKQEVAVQSAGEH